MPLRKKKGRRYFDGEPWVVYEVDFTNKSVRFRTMSGDSIDVRETPAIARAGRTLLKLVRAYKPKRIRL